MLEYNIYLLHLHSGLMSLDQITAVYAIVNKMNKYILIKSETN